MNPTRHLRPVKPLAIALLCGLLAACTGGGSSSAKSSSAATASPSKTALAMKTAAASPLCAVLDLTTAGEVLTSPQYSPELEPAKGTAPNECSYATSGGQSLLSFAPTSRPYATEVAAVHSVLKDPAASGMSSVRIQDVSGLGQAAFEESAYMTQAQQTLTWVVWRSGTRTWVLSLAQITATDAPSRLLSVAKQISHPDFPDEPPMLASSHEARIRLCIPAQHLMSHSTHRNHPNPPRE